jgi:predicted small integral membrane protein
MYSHLSYWLVTIVDGLTSFLAYFFDWDETHVYKARWPPHAAFHNAQTLILGPLLGLSSLWFLWGRH